MERYKLPNLDEIVKETKALGEVLVSFNYPKAPILSLEDDLGIFKAREAVVDGYPLFLHYQKSDYDQYLIETLQIHSLKSPFLPFNLICKIGRRFLGSEHLSLIEIYKQHRKIYIWSVSTDVDGNPVPIPDQTQIEECEFEGFQYSYLQPTNIDFF